VIKGHGGNIYDVARAIGCKPADVVDMSSNMNPLGPPPELVAFLQNRMDAITVLPEPDAGRAAAGFARQNGLDPDRVIAGNGTTQFIYALPEALGIRQALIVGPTYADYADACRRCGADCDFFLMDAHRNFRPDLAALNTALNGIDTVFICNPNNPSGRLIDGRDLADLCRRHRHIRFVVDESYLSFVEGGDAHSLMGRQIPNAVVLHSMSKIFRIPGLRIGFAVAAGDNMAGLRRTGLPWNVNALALAAVQFLTTRADDVIDFVRRSQTYLAAEKGRIFSGLKERSGIEPIPSRTAFFLARLPCGQTAGAVAAGLLEDRILVRDCSNFFGLNDRYIRVSLKTADINDRLLERLSTLCPKIPAAATGEPFQGPPVKPTP
jgi:threonine-phosphate decarboxylase